MANFFETITKHATEIKNRAMFEASKLQRTNEITSEIKALFVRRDQLFMEVGKRTLDLVKNGTPVNQEMVSALEQKNGYDVQIAIKQQHLPPSKKNRGRTPCRPVQETPRPQKPDDWLGKH